MCVMNHSLLALLALFLLFNLHTVVGISKQEAARQAYQRVERDLKSFTGKNTREQKRVRRDLVSMNYIPQLSIAGVGFLGAYELGALQALVELGLVSLNKTQLNGGSSGSLVVGHFCAGIPFQTLYNADYGITQSCASSKYQCFETLTDAEIGMFNLTFQGVSDATIAAQCSNTYIQMTPVANTTCGGGYFTKQYPNVTGSLLVGGFSTVQELKNAMLGSSYLPELSSTSCFYSFNGTLVIDAGYSHDAPCKGGACVVITGQIKTDWLNYVADIYPGVNNGQLPTGMTAQNFTDGLLPSSISPFYNALYLQGQADAKYWANLNFFQNGTNNGTTGPPTSSAHSFGTSVVAIGITLMLAFFTQM